VQPHPESWHNLPHASTQANYGNSNSNVLQLREHNQIRYQWKKPQETGGKVLRPFDRQILPSLRVVALQERQLAPMNPLHAVEHVVLSIFFLFWLLLAAVFETLKVCQALCAAIAQQQPVLLLCCFVMLMRNLIAFACSSCCNMLCVFCIFLPFVSAIL
jgi:hypothetical protein